MAFAEKTVDIQGHTYKIVQHNVMEQFNYARRLVKLFITDDNKSKEEKISSFVDFVSGMSDAEATGLLCRILSKTSRKQDGGVGFAPVIGAQSQSIMFDDIDLVTLLELSAEALMFNLQNFTQGHIKSLAQGQKLNAN